MPSPPDAVAESGQYITFKLGDELFAVNVVHVREVLDLTPITRGPTAPAYMRGVVNVRGKAIPVVDLRARFGLPAAAPTVQTRILVLELTLDGEPLIVGGQADSVREVIELEPGQIAPGPQLATRWRSEMVRGMTRRGDDFVIILDVAQIFTLDELGVATTAADVAAAS
jgi:purine-binding chemotaxis protein CheW